MLNPVCYVMFLNLVKQHKLQDVGGGLYKCTWNVFTNLPRTFSADNVVYEIHDVKHSFELSANDYGVVPIVILTLEHVGQSMDYIKEWTNQL